MRIGDEPKTDAELATRLRALYAASEHSGGARDDFWDTVSCHIGRIVDLVEKAAKVKRDRGVTARSAGVAGGRARMAALSPERRSEIARSGAEARWRPEAKKADTGEG